MTREQLEKLTAKASENYDAIVKAVSVKPEPKTKDPLKEYFIEDHPIFDPAERPDVPVKKDGVELRKRKVTRIGLSFEQLITSRAAAFLCANPIIYKATPDGPAEEKMWEAFKKVNESTKLDFKNLAILEKRMSETEIAEIWYFEDIDDDQDDYWNGTQVTAKKKLRLFLSASSLGDKLYPVWDGQDNFIAFGRGYTGKAEDGQDVEQFDLYTPDKIFEGVKSGSSWTVIENPNQVKKVVVVYHSQPDVEWANVRPEIRRMETLTSNLGDSNDKTTSPILFVEGDITSLPEGTTGRVVKGKTGAKISYVTADNAPESLRLEAENLLKFIYSLSDTPDISLDNLKGIGNTSGFAIQLMFLGAHLKAARHAGTFGECIQRRINLIKRMLIAIDPSLKDGTTLTITPTFDYFLPKDVQGIIEYLSAASMGERPILSQETATVTLQDAMGGDGEAEYDRITAQQTGSGALNEQMNNA